MPFDELHMLDHRMPVESTELSNDPQQEWLRLRALEFDLAFPDITLDAGQQFQEIVLPGRTAELTVGHRFQPDIFLLLDDALDLAILDRFERGIIDLTFLA